MSSKTSPLMGILQEVQAVKRSLEDRRELLAAESEKLSKRLAEISRAPLSQTDAKAMMLNEVDRMAAAFVRGHNLPGVFRAFAFPPRRGGEDAFQEAAAGKGGTMPLCMTDADEAKNGAGSRVFGAALDHLIFGISSSGRALSNDMMAFYFGDLIKAKLDQHFDKLWPRFSSNATVPTSLEDRRAEAGDVSTRLKEVEDELESIESQLQQLKRPI